MACSGRSRTFCQNAAKSYYRSLHRPNRGVHELLKNAVGVRSFRLLLRREDTDGQGMAPLRLFLINDCPALARTMRVIGVVLQRTIVSLPMQVIRSYGFSVPVRPDAICLRNTAIATASTSDFAFGGTKAFGRSCSGSPRISRISNASCPMRPVAKHIDTQPGRLAASQAIARTKGKGDSIRNPPGGWRLRDASARHHYRELTVPWR